MKTLSSRARSSVSPVEPLLNPKRRLPPCLGVAARTRPAIDIATPAETPAAEGVSCELLFEIGEDVVLGVVHELTPVWRSGRVHRGGDHYEPWIPSVEIGKNDRGYPLISSLSSVSESISRLRETSHPPRAFRHRGDISPRVGVADAGEILVSVPGRREPCRVDDVELVGRRFVDHPVGKKLADAAPGADPDRQAGGKPQPRMALRRPHHGAAIGGKAEGSVVHGLQTDPAEDSWMTFSAGKTGVRYGVSFCRSESRYRFRLELYIDANHPQEAARRFKKLRDRKTEIEAAFGGTLAWEVLSKSRANRISSYYPGDVRVRDRDRWSDLRAWAINGIGPFKQALQPHTSTRCPNLGSIQKSVRCLAGTTDGRTCCGPDSCLN